MKPKFTGSNRTVSGEEIGKSKNVKGNGRRKYPCLAICVGNTGNEASLEKGKAYRVIKPLPNDPPHRIRVIDEENEDYLYPADWFVPIEIPSGARRSVLEAIST